MTLACPTARTLLARRKLPPPQPLDFVVVGLNHQTAPVEVREGAAVRPGDEARLLGKLAPFAEEVLLLATCNRTEVYLAGLRRDPVLAFQGAWGRDFGEHLYLHEGEQAIRHLYRVTAGLDSLVIGETQIQGQVKRAWQAARDQGLCGTLMNKVAQGALAAGKRVRTETGLSHRVVSVSGAAVELAAAALGDLSRRTALIIGAGETAELTLTHLRAAGIGDVIVVNRTAERARVLAEKLGGRACPAEALQAALPEADVVIASSAAPHYVLGPQGVRDALLGRPERGMFLIDISVPRILDPEIIGVPGAYLYNLDDLTAVVQRNMESRRAALPYAEVIIRELGTDLSRWHLTRETQRGTLARSGRLALACD